MFAEKSLRPTKLKAGVLEASNFGQMHETLHGYCVKVQSKLMVQVVVVRCEND